MQGTRIQGPWSKKIMDLVTIKIEELNPAEYNPRVITEEELKKLKQSIEEFGYVEPIVYNENTKRIISGHQRIKVLKELGYKEIKAIKLNLSETKERSLNLALNKIRGNWDNQKLVQVLKEIHEKDEEQLPNTGFSDSEIMYLLELERRERERINAMEDYFTKVEETNIQVGDIIQCGNHKILCGDSADPHNWRKLLGEERVDLIITSPPYNLDIGYGKYKDNKELEEYLKFIKKVFANLISYLNKGRYICVNIGREWGPINMPARYDHIFRELNLVFFRNIYWTKPLGSARVGSIRNPFPRYYKPKVQTEIIQLYTKEPIPDADLMIKYTYGVERPEQKESIPDILIQKYAGNIWEMHTETTLGQEHPAPFPVQLPFNCIRFYSYENEIVVDPFAGAATTMIAAEQLGRKGRMLEMDPLYVQVAVNRYKKMFPNKAVKCLNRQIEL
jgi:DNA modification methylase